MPDELLGITLLDHVILGAGRFFSFKAGDGPDVKTLYFDCFAGAAGDMMLGALIDAGLPFDELERALGSLAVDGVRCRVDRVVKTGVTATKFRVHRTASGRPCADPESSGAPHAPCTPAPPLSSLKHILAAIRDGSALQPPAKARATRMFHRLAEAEAADPPHADGEGSPARGRRARLDHRHRRRRCSRIEWFGADRIVVSPLNVGGGMVTIGARRVSGAGAGDRAAAGQRADLLERRPDRAGDADRRADPVATTRTSFGPMPAMRVERVGYGAGDRDLPDTPNVRARLGRRGATGESSPAPDRRCASSVIECEIDDMNPQIFGALMDRLYAAGALECSTRRCR